MASHAWTGKLFFPQTTPDPRSVAVVRPGRADYIGKLDIGAAPEEKSALPVALEWCFEISPAEIMVLAIGETAVQEYEIELGTVDQTRVSQTMTLSIVRIGSEATVGARYSQSGSGAVPVDSTPGLENPAQAMLGLLTSDIHEHRDHVHKLYSRALAVFGLLVVAAVGLTYWLLGKQLNDQVADLAIAPAVENHAGKIVERQVMQEFARQKNKIQTAINTSVNTAIHNASLTISSKVDEELENAAKKKMGDHLQKEIERKFSEIELKFDTADNTSIIEKLILPKGAIVAFDGIETCMDGWTDVVATEGDRKRFAGRVLLVAGPPTKRKSNESTRQRRVGADGGMETVALETQHMPEHHHRGSFAHESGVLLYAHPNAVNNFRVAEATSGLRFGEHVNTPLKITPEGKGVAHENMPPFIALRFCRKN